MPDISRRMAMDETTHSWHIDKIEWLNELKSGKVSKFREVRKSNSKRLKREIQK